MEELFLVDNNDIGGQESEPAPVYTRESGALSEQMLPPQHKGGEGWCFYAR